MLAATPQLQLATLFVLDDHGQIVSTREPRPSPGPAFMLIRGEAEVAWAIRADVSQEAAQELEHLARQEPACSQWEEPPLHARRYQAMLGGRVHCGPAFEFSDKISREFSKEISVFGLAEPVEDAYGVTRIHDEAQLQRDFTGWAADEIEAGAAPVMAVLMDGQPVSICCCARRSAVAAEAGLETAAAFRGRGFASRVVAAWATAVRSSGRTPLYSTSWNNLSSRAVAHKLKLKTYASDWSFES